MPDLDQLLKDSARQPGSTPDVQVLWRRGRRRRGGSAIAAGVMALIVIGLAVPRVLSEPTTDIDFIPRASEPAAASDPAPSDLAPTETVNDDGTRTLVVGGAEFDVPADWPVTRLTSADGAPCVNPAFGGHRVFIATEIYPVPCPYSGESSSSTTAVYAMPHIVVEGSVKGRPLRTDNADAFVQRRGGLDWYQFADLDLVLVLAPAEPRVVDAIVG